MNRIETIARNKRTQGMLRHLADRVERVIETAVAIQQIPAPTFAEAKRANYIQSQFTAAGLQDVAWDELYNVYGRFPGASPQHPPVILSAHSDTVFPADTDLTVRRNGRLICGPGLADNSIGVAGMLGLAQTLVEHNPPLLADIWFVANVGEEGLGDLRGMKAVVERFGRDAVYIVVEGGLFGQISHQAIGVRRFRIEIKTGGGHSWGNFGRPSAIHELAHLIAAIDRLSVPAAPKTTYNVGVIQGGTSVNSIAHSAAMQLDLRSEEPALLAGLVSAVEEIIAAAQARLAVDDRNDVLITMTEIGNRPAGSISRQAPLVVWAEESLRYVGCHQVRYVVSSTDANVPLSQGVTAVCVGLTKSGNAHRLDEYIDPINLPNGLKHLLLLTLAAAG
ncbi:MAG: M20/M25/M40 family metallo-hydrolase [Chloroflexi bacterium]|nr:M20/M25/M40 family metallo-hydrolase [Chloroflexota bacterium]